MLLQNVWMFGCAKTEENVWMFATLVNVWMFGFAGKNGILIYCHLVDFHGPSSKWYKNITVYLIDSHNHIHFDILVSVYILTLKISMNLYS